MITDREASAVPFEIVGLAFAVPVGLSTLIFGLPSSIQIALPPLLQYGWAIFFTLGSAMALLGLVTRRAAGIYMEQIGVLAAGTACLVYAAALLGRQDLQMFNAYFPATMIGAYGVACLWRGWQLQKILQRAASIVRTRREE